MNQKPPSPAKIAANQANARKSTGPKTAAGRAASSKNATKHAFFSQELLVRCRNLDESPREFDALCRRFHQELQPVGPVEEMLVEQIVATKWRLRRVLLAESGEIALSVDAGEMDRARGKDLIGTLRKIHLLGNQLGNYDWERTTAGIEFLQACLRALVRAVEQNGELTDADLKHLENQLGGKMNFQVLSLQQFRSTLGALTAGLEGDALREGRKSHTLVFLNRELEHLEWKKSEYCEVEESEEDARLAAAALPSLAVLDRITRYETQMHRQSSRALAQLERLQRIRRGETVPAPTSALVS